MEGTGVLVRLPLASPHLPSSLAEVRTRASIAVVPLGSDSPYLGACNPPPGDPASRSVLGPLNLHLHRDPAHLGWSLCTPSFPEAEAAAECSSQPSPSRSGLQGEGGVGVGGPLRSADLRIPLQQLRTQRSHPSAHLSVARVARTAAVCWGRTWAGLWRMCPM